MTQRTSSSLEQQSTTLMSKALKGDQQAYADLLHLLAPFLRHVIAGKINIQTDVEDIVQEILISLHKARGTYNSSRPFIPWLMAIAHYRLMDYFRKSYRDTEHNASISYDDIAQQWSEEHAYHTVTDNDIRIEYIEEAIDSLPEKHQQILLLLHKEGYTSKEVAKKLNMTLSAVKVTAHRLYKRIRQDIETKQET